jgi:hypothetical protein
VLKAAKISSLVSGNWIFVLCRGEKVKAMLTVEIITND